MDFRKLLLWTAGTALTLRGAPEAAPAADLVPSAWSIHAQSTLIFQGHPAFSADYSGQNSLESRGEDAHTVTATLFLGHSLWPCAALFFNPEATQGTGLSNTLGVAGFPDGEATHAGDGGIKAGTARLFVRQVFGLGGDREKVEDDQNQVAGGQDVNRFTLTLGKFSAADIFDSVSYSHDPRTQFLNWALMDNGAWDYPANAKGYTAGLALEWNQASRTLRWGAFLEPANANGFALDYHLAKAWAQVAEWEERYALGNRPGAVHALLYWNRADMGSYAQALQGIQPPDILLSRSYRSKVGAGLSWEQALTGNLGAFSRVGWNDGKAETWAFTEIDRTVSAGLSWKGAAWGRATDAAGLAAVANGLSEEHRRYLAAGGYGFIIGDGRLDYGPEELFEAYYNWQLVPWLTLAPDYQFVEHPAYNRSRGPVSVWGVRAHLQH